MSITQTYPNQVINGLADDNLFAGTNKTYYYTITDSTGSPVDLGTAQSLTWKLTSIDSPIAVVTKTATYISSGSNNNILKVNIVPSDTINLTGQFFLQQYIIVDFAGKTFRDQGKIYLTPASV